MPDLVNRRVKIGGRICRPAAALFEFSAFATRARSISFNAHPSQSITFENGAPGPSRAGVAEVPRISTHGGQLIRGTSAGFFRLVTAAPLFERFGDPESNLRVKKRDMR